VVFPSLLERLHQGQEVVGLPELYVRGGRPPTTRIFAQDLDLLPLPEADLWASADPKDRSTRHAPRDAIPLAEREEHREMRKLSFSRFLPPRRGRRLMFVRLLVRRKPPEHLPHLVELMVQGLDLAAKVLDILL
jgi:hypothetical protein